MAIDFSNLNCTSCPALHLRDIERIKVVETMRAQALEKFGGKSACMILLCESTPAHAFVYDLNSNSNLRKNLRKELVPGGSDEALFTYFNNHRIWIVDCALCPVHLLKNNTDKRLAATICLERHNVVNLQAERKAKLVTIFPVHRGFKKNDLKRDLPSIAQRVIINYPFSNLAGLKEFVESQRCNSSEDI
jgi:hypothetical protein